MSSCSSKRQRQTETKLRVGTPWVHTLFFNPNSIWGGGACDAKLKEVVKGYTEGSKSVKFPTTKLLKQCNTLTDCIEIKNT